MLLVGQSHRTNKALAADLLHITGDGKPQSQQHNNPAMTTLTDSARKIIFYAPPGVYTIDQKTPTTGFVNIGDNDGGDINSIDIDIRSGSLFNNEFVDKRPGLKPVISPAPSAQKLGSISGCVKEDTDNNDSGDTNLVGVVLTLYDHTGNVIATTTHP